MNERTMMTAMASIALLGISMPEVMPIACPYRPSRGRNRPAPRRAVAGLAPVHRLTGHLRNQVCDCGTGLKRKKCPCGGIPKNQTGGAVAPRH